MISQAGLGTMRPCLPKGHAFSSLALTPTLFLGGLFLGRERVGVMLPLGDKGRQNTPSRFPRVGRQPIHQSVQVPLSFVHGDSHVPTPQVSIRAGA